MAVQGNILSFDEAKKTGDRTRPSVAASKNIAKKSARRDTVKSSSVAKSATVAKTKRPSVSGKLPTIKANASVKKTSQAMRPSAKKATKPPTKSPKTGTKPNQPAQTVSTNKRRQAPIKQSPKAPSYTQESSVKNARKRPAPTKMTKNSLSLKPSDSGRIDFREDGGSQRGELDSSQPTEKRMKISRFSEIKRNLGKSKASKEFTKQFGSTSSDASTSGPRAALYKGEMGRQHKRMTQMQGSGMQQSGASRRFSFTGFDWRNSPKFIASFMVVACLALSCVFLYPAAKQYYIAVREHDQLEAEYDAVQERNSIIQSQVDALSSPEGIEDRARQEFGWIKEGENSATVYGLEDANEEKSYTKSIPAGSVAAPKTWYSAFLDTIFGVE